MNIFDITPTTFVIDLDEESCETNLNNFLKFYEENIPPNMKKNFQPKMLNEVRRKLR